MKRSEMIQKIANLISGHDHNPEYDISDYDLEMSHWVLDLVEKEGMLPPEVDVVREGHDCTENIWEKE